MIGRIFEMGMPSCWHHVAIIHALRDLVVKIHRPNKCYDKLSPSEALGCCDVTTLFWRPSDPVFSADHRPVFIRYMAPLVCYYMTQQKEYNSFNL